MTAAAAIAWNWGKFFIQFTRKGTDALFCIWEILTPGGIKCSFISCWCIVDAVKGGALNESDDAIMGKWCLEFVM